jgi:hypothetical protein
MVAKYKCGHYDGHMAILCGLAIELRKKQTR